MFDPSRKVHAVFQRQVHLYNDYIGPISFDHSPAGLAICSLLDMQISIQGEQSIPKRLPEHWIIVYQKCGYHLSSPSVYGIPHLRVLLTNESFCSPTLQGLSLTHEQHVGQ